MVYVYVGVGGSLGAMLRYWIGMILFTDQAFPFATLFVNLVGSFLLAWFTTQLFRKISIPPAVATAIGTGFVGSFTTFSTFSVETIELFQSGEIFFGTVYIAVSIVGGMIMSRLGFHVHKEGTT